MSTEPAPAHGTAATHPGQDASRSTARDHVMQMLPPGRIATCRRPVQFFPVVVAWPEPPAPESLIVAGDLVLGGVTEARGAKMPITYYHLGTYEARPAEFDPSHRCGVCDLYADRDPADMVLVHDDPPNWPGVCDPAARDELIAVVPRALR